LKNKNYSSQNALGLSTGSNSSIKKIFVELLNVTLSNPLIAPKRRAERHHFMMKLLCGFTLLLAVAAAYYIYIPLPKEIPEQWKLMVLDAIFRGVVSMVSITI